MKRVIVESPFAGDRRRNRRYLESCLRDCVLRGESPYASHKMLTDCLDDEVPEERKLGMGGGYTWWVVADDIVFYVDLGWSGGMQKARELLEAEGRSYLTRTLPEDDLFWLEEKRLAEAKEKAGR